MCVSCSIIRRRRRVAGRGYLRRAWRLPATVLRWFLSSNQQNSWVFGSVLSSGSSKNTRVVGWPAELCFPAALGGDVAASLGLFSWQPNGGCLGLVYFVKTEAKGARGCWVYIEQTGSKRVMVMRYGLRDGGFLRLFYEQNRREEEVVGLFLRSFVAGLLVSGSLVVVVFGLAA